MKIIDYFKSMFKQLPPIFILVGGVNSKQANFTMFNIFQQQYDSETQSAKFLKCKKFALTICNETLRYLSFHSFLFQLVDIVNLPSQKPQTSAQV